MKRRSLLFSVLLFSALVAFEIFNYSTTNFALLNLLGNLSFVGIQWATILTIAFCGIDFTGIARVFTPKRNDEPAHVWYLFGAWLLAAAMNASLTWLAVSIAMVNNLSFAGNPSLLHSVPVVIAVIVWFVRILIIGTLSFGKE